MDSGSNTTPGVHRVCRVPCRARDAHDRRTHRTSSFPRSCDWRHRGIVAERCPGAHSAPDALLSRRARFRLVHHPDAAALVRGSRPASSAPARAWPTSFASPANPSSRGSRSKSARSSCSTVAKAASAGGPAAFPYAPLPGPSFSVKLDGDGNATAVLWGGPSCAPGESLVSAHLEGPPYTTFTTDFMILPPAPSKPGVTAMPSSEIEDSVFSSVATIVEVEFPRSMRRDASTSAQNSCSHAA